MKLVARALHEENMSFSVVIREHKIRADLTPDKGGTDSGPTPPELLLGALAACSGVCARIFAVREGLASAKIEVMAEAEMDEPRVFAKLRSAGEVPRSSSREGGEAKGIRGAVCSGADPLSTLLGQAHP